MVHEQDATIERHPVLVHWFATRNTDEKKSQIAQLPHPFNLDSYIRMSNRSCNATAPDWCEAWASSSPCIHGCFDPHDSLISANHSLAPHMPTGLRSHLVLNEDACQSNRDKLLTTNAAH